jgi:diaminobutyrate acetyltransferase
MTGRDSALVRLRPCRESDAAGLHALAEGLPPLTVHTLYTYWSICRYAADTCLVAERDGAMVGMVTGFVCAARPITLFIWQLGVARDWRGSGLADRLLDRIVEAGRKAGAERLEVTIEQGNRASRKAFERLAGRMGSRLVDMGVAGVPERITSAENPEILCRISITGDQALPPTPG